MALADTAKLVVDLSLKGNFARNLGAASKSLDAFTKGESRAFKAGAQIGTGIRNAGKLAAVGVGILTSQVALGLDSLVKLEKATAQTEAVIKSTGTTAVKSAAQVRQLSEKYEALNATIGDEVIQSGQNLLLTFTAIGKDAFEPSLKAALDLSVALGTDLDTAIRTVGKALSEPDKAMARLRRQGIILTKAEEKQIKAHLENNDTLKAQTVILDALDKRYGGSFLAGGGTTAAKVAKFGDAIEDIQRSLATAMLPAVSNVADALSDLLADPAITKGAEDLGREIGNLFSKENIRAGVDALKGVFDTAREVAPIVGAAAKTMAGFISTAVAAFKSLPPEIQNLAIAGFAVNKLTGGLVTNIGGGLIGAVLRQLKSAVVTVHGGVVNVSGPGGVPGLGGKGGAGALLGIGLGPIAAAIAVALASHEVTTATNKSTGANFTNPFAGGIGGNIVSGLNNLAEVIKLWNPTRTSTPADRQHEGSGLRRDAAVTAVNKTTTAIETMKGNIGSSLGNIETKVGAAGVTAALAAKNAGDRGVSAALTNASLITAAIRANRPIINVDSRTIIDSRTYNSAVNRETTYINGGYNGGAPQGGR